MAIIKFVKGKNNSYAGMKKVIDYILNEKKTDVILTYGKDCSPDTAYYEFVQTKMEHHKESGRQYKHLIQSFADYESITPEQAHQIGIQLLGSKLFDGFQVVMATHKDRDHIHNHLVLNTVNDETGRKWEQSKEQLYELRDYSDELCRAHNLLVIPAIHKSRSLSDGEYRNAAKGTSWKRELWLAVTHSLSAGTSREDFIINMNRLGYQVNWTDNRKYVTFTTPEGKKCRNSKLYPPEEFTKKAMEKTLALNQRYAAKQNLKDDFELLISTVFLLSQSEDEALRKYPLSHLEGEALREYHIEQTKGMGLNTEKEYER